MNLKLGIMTLCLASSAFSVCAQTEAANHLVISEMGVYAPSGFSNAPASAEFTEVYNPTAATVDLSDFYLTDHGLYFDLPAIIAGQTDNQLTNGSDFLVKFPDGASIPSGGTVVVTNNGTSFTEAFFYGAYHKFQEQAGAPQLFEIWDSSPEIPNMGTNYNRSSADYPLDRGATVVADTGSNMSHTDAGEYTVLFYWDGEGAYVKDVDIVQYLPVGEEWGDSDNQYRNKSSMPAVGPNGEFGAYPFEFGSAANLDIKYPSGQVGQVTRRSILEPGETQTGGNGITGHDETMEINNLTWEMVLGAPTNASPGLSNLPLASASLPPVIGQSRRDVQHPAPGTNVKITAPVYGRGAFTATLMVDKGTGTFAPTPMTAEGNNIFGATISTAGLAEGTHVRWYVQAADAGGATSTEADFRQLGAEDFPGYHVFMVKSTPYQPTDLIISEIMYDPQGSNNSHHVQYVEIHNPGTTPFNFGSFVLGTDTYAVKAKAPEGTIIPPKGYIVFVGNREIFLRSYPGMDQSKIIDFSVDPSTAFMAHARTILHIYDPNVHGFDDNPVPLSAAFKTVEYYNTAPWPHGVQTGGAGNTGYPIELKTLVPGADVDPANWGIGLVYNGTPLAHNSLDETNRPGGSTITVSDVARDVLYPAENQPVTISAKVTTAEVLTAVEVKYSVNSGPYQTAAMTSTNNLDYTGTIGGFPDRALIKYYVVATSGLGHTGAFPYAAPVNIIPFYVQNVPSKANHVVINEVMYDPRGTDNGTYPEYIELHNPTDMPIDISFYQMGRNADLQVTDHYSRTFLEGSVIPPHGYFIMTPNRGLFERLYVNKYPNWYHNEFGDIDPSKILNLSWTVGTNHMANGDGSTFHLVHANEVDYYTYTDGVPFVSLNYKTSIPWPANGVNVNGPSIELLSPELPVTDPASWALPTMFHGTPLNWNSVSGPRASVSDWTLY